MDELQSAETSAYPKTYLQPQEILRNQQRMAEVLLRFAEPIPDDPLGNDLAETAPTPDKP